MAGNLFGEARIDPGHGLVEQDQLGLGHQRAADLDELLLAAGESGDRIVDDVVEPEAPGDAERPLGELRLAVAAGAAADQRGGQAFAGLALAVEHQVLEHAELREAAGELEGAHQATRDEPVGREAADGLAGQPDLAAIGPVEAGDDVEQGGLAGPVRTDQAGEAAGLDAEIDAVEHLDAVEATRQPADREEFAHASCPCRLRGAAGAGRSGKCRRAWSFQKSRSSRK